MLALSPRTNSRTVDRTEGRPIDRTRSHRATGQDVLVGEECLEHIREIHRVKALLTTELGLSEASVFECQVAISEAVSNALIHGRRNGTAYCRVAVTRRPEALHIVVEDKGSGFQWAGLPAGMPPAESEHGRGVQLIRQLMDGVAIHSTPGGTRVEMMKRLS